MRLFKKALFSLNQTSQQGLLLHFYTDNSCIFNLLQSGEDRTCWLLGFFSCSDFISCCQLIFRCFFILSGRNNHLLLFVPWIGVGVKFISGVSGHGFIKIHATFSSSGCAKSVCSELLCQMKWGNTIVFS